jgi:hypothetical protein
MKFYDPFHRSEVSSAMMLKGFSYLMIGVLAGWLAMTACGTASYLLNL